ncbi:hypothetical protein CYMTET_20958 [Cymbomonas tetramitiformis]|uniref:RING-type domain-containing protein n=1 Tax=Cymbomonas tetramitiformis TaxID=36881 RepID=A0AAE0L3C0_9CHLO|nr:hypothetical protein CYMTET_20958 [Cymbomonas tetramitiformis]
MDTVSPTNVKHAAAQNLELVRSISADQTRGNTTLKEAPAKKTVTVLEAPAGHSSGMQVVTRSLSSECRLTLVPGKMEPVEAAPVTPKFAASVTLTYGNQVVVPSENCGEAKVAQEASPVQCAICLETTTVVQPGGRCACTSCESTPCYTSDLHQGEQLCESPECSLKCCHQCLMDYLKTKVQESRFTCVAIKCPAPDCARHIPTKTWRRFVAPDVYMMYYESAKAALSMRCIECDDTQSRLVEDDVAEQARTKLTDRNKEFLLQLADKDRKKLQRACKRYARRTLEANAVVEVLAEVFAAGRCEDEDDQKPPRELEKLMNYVIPAQLEDVERRAGLQLAFLRRFPKVHYRCCRNVRVCFKCKMAGHHPGQTCQDRMRAEYKDHNIQYCPSCNVPTIRSQGCTSMVCVCGHGYEWEVGSDYEDDDDDNDDSGGWHSEEEYSD